ncbi:hypothetical protein B9T31_06930 [Acinetobacter sp. ANC 4558]|uniref:glycosyltransferase family 2 protein n=1 Tax=Acinetobacter sp. ANC 4558 TaxID=1977876 RepID=UPI000A3498E6|nr:glycosyltransferase family 2 protein [Acinetobacter sp. ANC 4558]OTG86723.1 hypothetical protein B9T31_06930 [Acinetobacter sp. ANC 4558]
MNPIIFLKIKLLLKQSRLIEVCAIDDSDYYLNLAWVYYRLGMYEAAFAIQVQNNNFETLFAKTVSASYLGKRDSVLDFLSIIQKKYPKRIALLIPYLATYYPECAYDLIHKTQSYQSPLYFSLCLLLEGKAFARKKYDEATNKSKLLYDNDERLLYANICVDGQNEKLVILNDYLNSFELSSIALQQPSGNLTVNNLKSNCTGISDALNKPLVSILVPAYNVERLLRTSIESLVNQYYKNLEILIIDDASTDNTATVIRDLEKQYSQVRGIFLSSNVGPFVAKNYAAQQALGEYLTTHDADDWAHPERISRQVQPLLDDKKLIATTCQWIRLGETGDFYAKQHFPFKRFNPSSPLFRKKQVIQDVGLWDSVRIAADTEFIERLRLVYGKKCIAYLKLPLVLGAHRTNSLMTSVDTGNLATHISPIRLSYWQAWRNWHIQQTKLGITPYMPWGADYQSQFEIPCAMQNEQLKLSKIYD